MLMKRSKIQFKTQVQYIIISAPYFKIQKILDFLMKKVVQINDFAINKIKSGSYLESLELLQRAEELLEVINFLKYKFKQIFLI